MLALTTRGLKKGVAAPLVHGTPLESVVRNICRGPEYREDGELYQPNAKGVVAVQKASEKPRAGAAPRGLSLPYVGVAGAYLE